MSVEPYEPEQAMVRRDLRNPVTDSWTDVLDDVADYARKIADTDFVPVAFRGKVAATAAAILTGREMGFPPMRSLRSLYAVHGRVGMYAEAMRAQALDAGHDIDYPESSSAKCVVRGRRAGSDTWTTITWTMDDARRAKLGGDQWAKYPRQMLQARATAELCRLLFPDALYGLPAVEELEQEGTAQLTQIRESRRVQRQQATPPPPPLEAAVSPAATDTPIHTDQPEIVAQTPTQPQSAAPEPAASQGAAEAGEVTSGDAAPPAAPPQPSTRSQLNTLRALLRAHNGTLTDLVVPIIGRPLHVATELSQPEAELVNGELQARLDRAKEPALLDADGAIPDPDA